MKALVGAAAFTAISTLITLVVGVGRTKLVALTLGVYGVGVLGQVNTALQFAASLIAVGFGNALVRRTAVADAEEGSPSSLLATSYVAILALAAPLVGFLLLAPADLVDKVFGQDSPPLARVGLAVAIPLVAITNIESAVVRGLKNTRMLALATGGAGLLGLGLLGPMVLVFGLSGALIHVGLFALLSYGLSYGARRIACGQANFRVSVVARPTRAALNMLLSYGSANAIAGVLNTATLLLVRTYVVDTLGVEANGLYQVLLGIPAQVLVIVLNTLSWYAFPLVSGMRERADITRALNLSLRFTLLAGTPLILGLVLFGAPVIHILYSAEFLTAARLLPLQLMGDFFKLVAWALGLSLLGRGHLVAFTLLDTVWNVVFAIGVVVLTPRFGLAGAATSYAVAYLLHASATYLYQHRREEFRLDERNFRLVILATGVLLGAILSSRAELIGLDIAYAAVGVAALAACGTQRTEWAALWRTAGARVRPMVLAR